jgi:hypothetical protein
MRGWIENIVFGIAVLMVVTGGAMIMAGMCMAVDKLSGNQEPKVEVRVTPDDWADSLGGSPMCEIAFDTVK